MTGTPRKSPYVWVSALSKLLVGEQPCEFSVQFQAKYQDFDKMPDSGNLALWSMDHTRELRKKADELKAQGYIVTIEDQNKHTYHSKRGISIGFKADLIAWKTGVVKCVYDIKTGQPRNSDTSQVLLEMLMIPCDQGEVYYSKTGQTVKLTKDLIGDEFMNNLDFCLGRLLAETSATKVPSEASCRFCKLTKDSCDVRWESPKP